MCCINLVSVARFLIVVGIFGLGHLFDNAGRQLTGGIPLGKQIMERLDANGDGRLQFSEFKAWFVNNFKNEKLNQQEEDAPDHVPRKICIDKNDNILLLDVGTNCIEVFKVVLKASIDDAGRASKKPVLKLVAELKETIDGKPLENPFSLSLGGKDHVLVGCEDTFLRIPWYGSGASVRNKTRVIRRLGPGDKVSWRARKKKPRSAVL